LEEEEEEEEEEGGVVLSKIAKTKGDYGGFASVQHGKVYVHETGSASAGTTIPECSSTLWAGCGLDLAARRYENLQPVPAVSLRARVDPGHVLH
jgi:hypothetical protein